jgi:hypothetical protein
MKRFFSALRGLFVGRAPSDPGLAPDAFADEVARRVRALSPDLDVRVVGALELAIGHGDGEGGNRAYLHNAYRMYQGEAPEARDALVDRFVRSFADAARGLEPSREAIIPIIKDRGWIAEVGASLQAVGGTPQEKVHEDLNDELVVVYALDTPSNIAYLLPGMLEELGVRRDELRGLSVRNLRGLLPGIEVHRGPQISMVTADGNYEASLLLFDDLWAREGEKLRGAPVAAVPARDLLLFADGADAEAVAQLRALASKMRDDATYALTDRLFIREGEGWRPL